MAAGLPCFSCLHSRPGPHKAPHGQMTLSLAIATCLCRHRILKQGCVGQDGSRRLALDVGANFGYFTLLAASMGCRQAGHFAFPGARLALCFVTLDGGHDGLGPRLLLPVHLIPGVL
jgi:hypothetical protein